MKLSPLFQLGLGLSAVGVGADSDAYDYVVVGAGTCGLVVANRLSEDPAVRVAVIEPGGDERNNPNVTSADGFQSTLGTHVDWVYHTVPQPGLNNKSLEYHSGKAIGGSSAINAMTYIRANKAEINAWESLGNPGWNWDTLFPYYKRTERFIVPTAAQAAAGATYNPAFHGVDGDVATSYSFQRTNQTEVASVLRETFELFSVPHNADSSGGNVHGNSVNPATMDRDTNLRWDAARAYWYPVEHRPNLKIIKGTATRITWADEGSERSGAGSVSAGGVEYVTEGGDTVVIKAAKEVVLSASTLRNPLILESSGVGNPSVLQHLGIDVKVDLPGVGENFQEQPNHGLAYAASSVNMTGYHNSQAFVTAADLFGGAEGAETVSKSIRARLSDWAKAAVDASGGAGLNQTAVEILLRTQHDLLFGVPNATLAELVIVATPPDQGGLMGANFWYLFPFSRGSVHLASGKKEDGGKKDNMLIDPRFHLADFDIEAQVAVAKFVERFWTTAPAADLADGGRAFPDLVTLPVDATDAQWRNYVIDNFIGNSHPIGTASMMSRELGGVVDPELRVYGTKNVRIVDSSIIPLQFSGHPTATLYAMAERAAEIIKNSSVYRQSS